MEASKQLSIEVTLRPHDLYTPLLWSGANIFYWVLALSASWILYDLYFAPPHGFLAGDAPPWIVRVALAIGILAVLVGLQYLAVLRLFQKYPAFRKTRRMTVSPREIVIESDDARSECKWSLFTRVWETSELFLFQQTERTATYVPKRCLSSIENVHLLRELIRENFRGKCRLRRD